MRVLPRPLSISDEYAFTTEGKAPTAAFTASNLSISPVEVNIGVAVTISILVANTGNAAGSYQVTLNINSVVEKVREVTLNAGASEEVTFTTVQDATGSYSVDVDGLSGSFAVREETTAPPPSPSPPPAPPPSPPAKPINWPVLSGIIAGAVVLSLIIFLTTKRRDI